METVESLRSWQQAFEEHSIASTRAIEKQLRASIANEKGKLRGLVGNNYRELLASAEQIVLLETQTKATEAHISALGQDCQPRQTQPRHDVHGSRRYIIVQLRLLQRCVSEAKTTLRGLDVLQCAQLVAIARVLAKSLADENVQPAPSLRDKVTSLRRALLRSVDLRLSNPLTDPSDMVKTCCAYCLVTSSSSIDALKHVQRLRLDKLRSMLSSEILNGHSLVEALRYHLDSLQVVKGLTGRPLIDALGKLQKRPILEDQSLKSIELLDLKAVEALLPEEIRSYMPYFKRTPLAAHEAEQMLESWSSDARNVISTGLQRCLLDIASVSEVLQLRSQLYTAFLPVYFSTAGHNGLHEVLRTAFDDHIRAISTGLGEVLSKISLELSNLATGTNIVGSLWQHEFAQMPLSNGGQSFIRHVRKRRLGKTASHQKSSKTIRAWVSSVHDMRGELANLRNIRWRDRLEEPDAEQEEEADQVVHALAQQDSESYVNHLQTSLEAAVATYESTLSQAITDLLGQEGKGLAAVNLLRAIRDSMLPLQRGFGAEHRFNKLQSTLPGLYGLIASEVVTRLSQSTGPPSPLSSTELEGLPSPTTFAFLRSLSAIMLEVGGTDVWSAGAVGAVREAVASYIFQEERKKHFMQTAFDDGYLRIALRQRSPEMDAPARIAVEEYWSRTKLLFGILA